jgi:hypothetical protein
MAEPAQVNHNGHDQNQQVHASRGLSCICHPGVCQRCQRQEQKPQERHNQPVIGVLQIMREKEQQHERDPRKYQNYDQYEAWHQRPPGIEATLSGLDPERRAVSRVAASARGADLKS